VRLASCSSRFDGNRAVGGGGAICLAGTASLTATHTRFSNTNYAAKSTGHIVWSLAAGKFNMTDCSLDMPAADPLTPSSDAPHNAYGTGLQLLRASRVTLQDTDLRCPPGTNINHVQPVPLINTRSRGDLVLAGGSELTTLM